MLNLGMARVRDEAPAASSSFPLGLVWSSKRRALMILSVTAPKPLSSRARSVSVMVRGSQAGVTASNPLESFSLPLCFVGIETCGSMAESRAPLLGVNELLEGGSSYVRSKE